MTAEKKAANILTIKVDYRGGDWSEKVLLTSDAHWDNPHSDHDLLRSDLDQALQGNHKICIGGDFFCLMQGRYDPRRKLGNVRPEHNAEDYLDRVVDTAIDFLKPYAKNILFIHSGNHESAIAKNNGTNVTQRLAEGLNRRCGTSIQHAGYRLWVRWMFKRVNQAQSLTMLVHHGPKGGNAPVTKGMIKTSRFQENYEADIFWYQHIHTQWTYPGTRYRLNHSLYEEIKPELHIQTGCYKDEQMGESDGYSIQRGHSAPGMGGQWLEFFTVKKSCESNYWVKCRAYQTRH